MASSTPSVVEKEVRKVTPPLITSGHVAERVSGYRPVRDGSPVMEVVEEGSKLIAHNYGHGGSGWTMAPGVASYVTRELTNRMTARGYNSEEPICIVGAGVMGLFCARDLVLLGYTNVTVRAAALDDLTSHKAGGLWAPAFIEMETADAEAAVRRMFKDSIDFYKAVIENPHDPLHRGVANVPLYSTAAKPYLEGLLDSPKQVVLDFGNGVKREVYAYDDAIYFEPNVIMQILGELLRMSGVRFESVKVNKLTELLERVIVNCTGLGARELVGDTKLHPNLGALLLLKGQDLPREALQYMILTEAKEALLYYFPKHSLTISAHHRDRAGDMGVLGGCCIEVKDETVRNEEEFDRILRDARWFFYGEE